MGTHLHHALSHGSHANCLSSFVISSDKERSRHTWFPWIVAHCWNIIMVTHLYFQLRPEFVMNIIFSEKIHYDKNIGIGHSSFVGCKTCSILFSENKLVHVFENSLSIMSYFVNYFKFVYEHFKFNSHPWYQIKVNYKLMTWTSIFLYKELKLGIYWSKVPTERLNAVKWVSKRTGYKCIFHITSD